MHIASTKEIGLWVYVFGPSIYKTGIRNILPPICTTALQAACTNEENEWKKMNLFSLALFYYERKTVRLSVDVSFTFNTQ